MVLSLLDWVIIGLFFGVTLIIGLSVRKSASRNAEEFFLSGRKMPWWLLGISMVATTFSADTPNLVTDIVRNNGISGNWVWWAFLLTGMLTVFVYAKLWRRSGVFTDLEFYELRYSGSKAAFLRGFRALYLGIIFNIVIMASVTLAAIKIGGVLLGLSPIQTVIIASTVTVVYAALGGLKGVLITDFFQFMMAMLGSIWAAIVLLNQPQIGGLQQLLEHDLVLPKLSFVPDFSDPSLYIPLLLVPLLVQWWSVWYPGAEPGGGGYIAQRMFAAKNEKHATGATLFFNIAHYALRPWPWIIIALCSLVVFPTVEDIGVAIPSIPSGMVKDDLAYSAMLTYLPAGLLGLVVASLIAAFMSTISTHLNWGASYITHDFFHRFIKRDASQSNLVKMGRWSTVLLMIMSSVLALYLSNALQAFNLLLQIGAGTGLLFLMRWFWWRINAWSEITAMIVSFAVAFFFEVIWVYLEWPPLTSTSKLLYGVGITTAAWVIVTFLTQPEDDQTLQQFYLKIRPYPFGWQPIISKFQLTPTASGKWTTELIAVGTGAVSVYCTLFGTGSLLFGHYIQGSILMVVAGIGTTVLVKMWKKLRWHDDKIPTK